MIQTTPYSRSESPSGRRYHSARTFVGLSSCRVYTSIVFVCVFGVEFNHVVVGSVYAVNRQTHSGFLCVADILFSGSVRCAPPFECDGCIEVYGLCGRAFVFPESHLRPAEQGVRSSFHFSVAVSFCQAAPRSICPQRSPTSLSLEIEFKRSN